MRKILAGLGPGVALSDSILERRLLEVLVAGGLPVPVQQYPRPWPDSLPGRVDFAYPSARLIIEVDGRRWHALRESFESDRRRDNLALVAGWRVLRFTWRQLVEEPVEVCRIIRAALALSAQTAS